MSKIDNIKINNPTLDKRVKLSTEDKHSILVLHFVGRISLRGLGRLYNVDKKTIKFVVDPEYYLKELERNRIKQSYKIYYTKEKHKIDMRKHRQYKKELYTQGLI